MSKVVRWLPALVAALGLFALNACGGGEGGAGGVDPEDAKRCIFDLDDQLSSAKKVPSAFADGPKLTPEQCKRYTEFTYEPVRVTATQGNEATVSVRVTDQKGKDLGEQSWVVVKTADGTWKIKSAPLP